MVCEQCQAREATVHFSTVAWQGSDDVTRHLCESCYPEVEAQRVASYQPKQRPLPAIDVEHITVQEYFDLSARAHANGEDAPTFRYVSEELKRLPATRERLAIEMLKTGLESIEKADPAWNLIGMGTFFGSWLPSPKPTAFVDLLEKMFLRLVERTAESARPASDPRLSFHLTTTASTLRRADQARFEKLMEELKSRPSPELLLVLDYLERYKAKLDTWVRKRRDRKHRKP